MIVLVAAFALIMLVLFVLLSFENDKLKRDLADRERQLSELLIGRKQ